MRHPRFKLFAATLAGVTAPALLLAPPPVAVVMGFDVAALIFLGSTVSLWCRGTPPTMRDSAARDDGGRGFLLAASAIVSGAILTALGLMVGSRAQLGAAEVGIVVVTLGLAWGFANTVYALHYAHLYYDQTEATEDNGGLEFPGTDLPEFSDFGYFAFVIGMTFQVSDVVITARRQRRVVIVHALLAFFFNIGVLALTINVLAGAL